MKQSFKIANYDPESMSWEELEQAHEADRLSLLKAVAEGANAMGGEAMTTKTFHGVRARHLQ